MNTHQDTSIHFRCWLKENRKHSTRSTIFGVSVVASTLPPNPLPGRSVAPPRQQRHHHGGLPRPTRRGPPPAADGARRRGRDGKRRRLDRAARGGAQRPRGDLPGAAGGGGRGGRQGPQWPLGPEEMDARCFGRFQDAKKNRIQHVNEM